MVGKIFNLYSSSLFSFYLLNTTDFYLYEYSLYLYYKNPIVIFSIYNRAPLLQYNITLTQYLTLRSLLLFTNLLIQIQFLIYPNVWLTLQNILTIQSTRLTALPCGRLPNATSCVGSSI